MFGARAAPPGQAMPGSWLHASRVPSPSCDRPAPAASRRVEPARQPAPAVTPLHRPQADQVAAHRRVRPSAVIVVAAHVAVVLALFLIVPTRRLAEGEPEAAPIGFVLAAPVTPAAPPPAEPEPPAPQRAAQADTPRPESAAEAALPSVASPLATLPKVWTPSIQPTPNALPPAPPSAAPSHIDPNWAEGVSDSLVQQRTTPIDPRLRNVHGVVVIRFRVAPDGQVERVWVLHGSGNRALDQAALALVRGTRVPPFPPDMAQVPQTVTLPIRFDLE